MNKPVLIVIGIVVILLLAGGGAWYVMTQKAPAEGEVPHEAAAVRDAEREQSSIDLSLEANVNAQGTADE